MWALSPPPPIGENAVFLFFSCAGTKAPPAAKMSWGYLSRKKIYIFLKFKITKTQVFDVETEGICVVVHNMHH